MNKNELKVMGTQVRQLKQWLRNNGSMDIVASKLLAECEQLRDQNTVAATLMDEAVVHCEVCRGLPRDSSRRCARCLSFVEYING